MPWVRVDDQFPEHDPADFVGAPPLPPGREVMPLCDFSPDRRLAIAEKVLAEHPPEPTFKVGHSDYLPLAVLPSRAWYEWHWARGIDPERIRRARIPDALRHAVYERDGHRCVTCGATESLSLDHIVPWSLGGPDTFDNFQTMCVPCNSRKGARV